MREQTGQAASSTETLDAGVAFLTTELPQVHDLNCAWLDRPPAEPPRVPKVLYTDEAVAPALPGWNSRRIEVLAWRRDPPPRSDAVEQVDLDTQAPVQAAINREVGFDEELVTQLDDANRRREQRTGKRSFGRMVSGRAVALADLYSDGTVSQVEDVATLPDHRRRGHGREVVLHAVAMATGHDLIFLVAGEANAPWYERMGFERVGGYWEASPM
ncbi:MAG TPA: GNAT family N-acetyltransferase [Thermoleophilaceae bacterium]|nr:GNAT family N-acetyltransferase [Thermoleophilaceae bacterium]